MPRKKLVHREFGIGQAAWFFDQDTQWLRWREREGHLQNPDGTPLLPNRKESNKLGGGDRRYTLKDIRVMAHALRRSDVLDDEALKAVLHRVDVFSSPIKGE